MNRDILFKTENFIFSLRVSGILRCEDRILLQRDNRTGEYATIGGHVSGMETAAETLLREFREELHADIAVEGLLCTGEIFFQWGKLPCHQICLFYDVRLLNDAQIPESDVFQGYDDFGDPREDLDYCWVSLSEIENGLKIYPLEIVPFLLGNGKQGDCFISNELSI